MKLKPFIKSFLLKHFGLVSIHDNAFQKILNLAADNLCGRSEMIMMELENAYGDNFGENRNNPKVLERINKAKRWEKDNDLDYEKITAFRIN